IFGGDDYWLDITELNEGAISAGRNIIVAVGEGGTVDLRGLSNKAFKAVGNFEIYANTILLDEGVSLYDLIEAQEIIYRPSKIIYHVVLSGQQQTKGQPDTIMPINLDVINGGPKVDTYILNVISENGWNVSSLPSTITIDGLKRKNLTLNVTLPSTPSAKDMITITVTSQTDSKVVAVIEVMVGVEGTLVSPASCQLYAVNDAGLNNSQFFTVNLDSLAVNELGPVYKAHDIESLAVHPKTDMLYAASGDNAEKQGFFYQVDGKTGELHPIGNTGFKEIEDLTFAFDGTLYAWAKGDGLITIDPITGIGTLVLASNIQVEGLTLGKDIYGSFNNMLYGSVNTELWTYDMNTKKLEVTCTNLFGETEALEVMPYGELLVGTHNVAFGMHAFNPDGCHISTADATLSNKFKDVEGLALPIAACSVCGDTVVQGNEQCDDGNTMSGDLCSDICMIE
ncbi:myxococcus cysteine-rich repeat containing protein, partial [Thiotrichales bacterium HSG1]|nr:myxococcus cysteine-rich repeat containing protein [Thiotrichales bacterium HSG1]